MRLYLDTCFLNRPWDDQRQDRIFRETLALLDILDRCESAADWELIGSEALDIETSRIKDMDRREGIKAFLSIAKYHVQIQDHVWSPASAIYEDGIVGFDALHVGCALVGNANVLLTVDDKLHKRARQSTHCAPLLVAMPVEWLQSMKEGENQ